jgi:hypothetical protein
MLAPVGAGAAFNRPRPTNEYKFFGFSFPNSTWYLSIADCTAATSVRHETRLLGLTKGSSTATSNATTSRMTRNSTTRGRRRSDPFAAARREGERASRNDRTDCASPVSAARASRNDWTVCDSPSSTIRAPRHSHRGCAKNTVIDDSGVRVHSPAVPPESRSSLRPASLFVLMRLRVEGGDLNPHALAGTRPSTLRVNPFSRAHVRAGPRKTGCTTSACASSCVRMRVVQRRSLANR